MSNTDLFGLVWGVTTVAMCLPLSVMFTCFAIREVRKIWRGEW
jgi:hypothetical protein